LTFNGTSYPTPGEAIPQGNPVFGPLDMLLV